MGDEPGIGWDTGSGRRSGRTHVAGAGNPFGAAGGDNAGAAGNPFATASSAAPAGHSSKSAPMSSSNLRREDSRLVGMSSEELQQHVVHNLTLIQTTLQLIQNWIDVLGKPGDSRSHRDMCSSHISAVKSKIDRTARYLKDLAKSEARRKKRGEPVPAANISKRKKLEKDLASLGGSLKKLTRSFQLKERQFRAPSNSDAGQDADDFAGSDGPDGGASGPRDVSGVHGLVSGDGSYMSQEQVQAQLREQMRVQGHLEVNEAIINERHDAMVSMNKQLLEVREIFTDLAIMLEEQDEGIEAVSENMKKTADVTANAVKQLEKAEQSQRSRCHIS